MPHVDPRLTKAIEDARANAAGGCTVQAVVTLRSPDPARPAMDAAQTTRSVRRIVARASRHAHSTPRDVRIFEHIQSFAIDADAEIVDSILKDEDVEAASYEGPSSPA